RSAFRVRSGALVLLLQPLDKVQLPECCCVVGNLLRSSCSLRISDFGLLSSFGLRHSSFTSDFVSIRTHFCRRGKPRGPACSVTCSRALSQKSGALTNRSARVTF